MKRLALSIVLVAALLASCGNDPVAPEVEEGIFPLDPGTTWHYVSGDSARVGDAVVVGGVEYSPLVGPLFEDALARLDRSGKFFVRSSPASPVESLLFDFGVPPGTSWTYAVEGTEEIPPTVTLVSNDDTVTVPAGTYSGCYTFLFDVSKDVETDITYVVAPQVGIVRILYHTGVADALVSFTPGDEPGV